MNTAGSGESIVTELPLRAAIEYIVLMPKPKKPWTRAQKLLVCTGIGVPILLGVLQLLRSGKPVAPTATQTVTQTVTVTQPPTSHVVPDAAKSKPSKPTTKPVPPQIEQHGTGNGAVGSIDQSGNCNINQIGGSGNQATANCAPVERHLSEQQKAALSSLVVPASVKLTLTMTNEGDAQSYGREIGDALNLSPANRTLACLIHQD